MKGLIYKDLLSLKQVVITMGVLAVFYFCMGHMSGGATNYFPMLAMLINMMASLSCSSYDEQCGWDSFGNALPVSRKQAVIARYGMNILVMIVTTAIVIASEFFYSAVYSNKIDIVEIIYPIVASLIYVSITNPIIYKLGANKARLVVVAVVIVPVILSVGLAIVFLTMPDKGQVSFSDTTSISWSTEEDAWEDDTIAEFDLDNEIHGVGVPIIAGVSAASLGIYGLSMLGSISIYKKKEF